MAHFKSGLVGYTGFVGGTLHRSRQFDALYNSVNIEEIAGASFDRLVCAGAPAAKWQANKEPERDWAQITRLIDALSAAQIKKFVLVSTIDIYPNPSRPDDEDSPIADAENHAYGKHRYQLECWARQRFADASIVRLPALFGYGLKKNAIFDLLRENQVAQINPAAVFQWYPMSRFADDLDKIEGLGLSTVNLFTEPMAMRSILDRFFRDARVGVEVNPAPAYRVKTKYSRLFGGTNGYVLSQDQILTALGEFVKAERARMVI